MNKKVTPSRTLLGILALSLASQVHAVDLNNGLNQWMASVADTVSLKSMTIPGTHDSGALYEPVAGTAKCQSLSIADQLNNGVRFLDIRLRQINNALVLHHGSVYQNQNFDDVLGTVTSFLAAHPSETVLMSVKNEYTSTGSTETYEQTFMRYVNNPSYAARWSQGTSIPNLGSVRGKIVLLRRFSGSASTAGGIDLTNWPDNTTFSTSDSVGNPITVQDNYQVSFTTNNNKWNAIKSLLDAAPSNSSNLYLNFTSGYRSILGIPNITGVSNDIDTRLTNYFNNNGWIGVRYGVVISDFITKSIVQAELAKYFG